MAISKDDVTLAMSEDVLTAAKAGQLTSGDLNNLHDADKQASIFTCKQLERLHIQAGGSALNWDPS